MISRVSENSQDFGMSMKKSRCAKSREKSVGGHESRKSFFFSQIVFCSLKAINGLFRSQAGFFAENLNSVEDNGRILTTTPFIG